jgi:hypothetical protein
LQPRPSKAISTSIQNSEVALDGLQGLIVS